MKLPEDIDISTVLHFDPNYELTFRRPYPPSWELEESLKLQDTIDENWKILEKRYNEYALVHNLYHARQSAESTEGKDRIKDACPLARISLYYSGLVGENEAPKAWSAGKQLLTRVIFSKMVDAMHNELPTTHTFEETSSVNFARITYEAEMPYMLTDYQEEDGEY